jgi:hypothetical protein
VARSSSSDLFEDQVFEGLTAKRKRTAAVDHDFNTLVFTTAKEKAGVQVQETDKGYLVTFGRAATASGGRQRVGSRQVTARQVAAYIASDNPVNLKFTDDYFYFEPEEGLIHKSKLPLWVVRPVGGNAVAIIRTWETG